ncbi:MAG: hypothetical protein LBG11_01715 [Bifidobacteriaceae bacterium]|jgi:folate-binding protein YgfZ|nr:hypothetical protein [Bifidobacteriaceae bacterium]
MGRYDLADQRSFATGEPVFCLAPEVGVVGLKGPDALALLSALTTLPPQEEPPPPGTEALVFNAQGHIQFAFQLAEPVPGDSSDWLLLTDGLAQALAGFLNSRRFRLRAEATARTDLAVALTPGPLNQSVFGPDGVDWASSPDGWPGTPDWPNRAGLEARPESLNQWDKPDEPYQVDQPSQPNLPQRRWRQAVKPRYCLVEPHPGAGWRGMTSHIYDPTAPNPLPERLERRGYRQIDGAALEALRIAAWRPLASREAADGKTLPHELDWLRTTTPVNSGCYPGQETVAKIINVGKPPRRLVFLHLDGSDGVLPQVGAAVTVARSELGGTDEAAGGTASAACGLLTSVGVHHELGPIALALVKRTTPRDVDLLVDALDAPGGLIAASQTEIVPVNGESDARPARRATLPKLSRRARVQ